MRNTGLEEAQAGIKIAGRNISHLAGLSGADGRGEPAPVQTHGFVLARSLGGHLVPVQDFS